MLMGYEWNMYQNLNTWNVLNESHTDEVQEDWGPAEIVPLYKDNEERTKCKNDGDISF